MDHEGETPKQAAARELLEETGLAPKTLKLWKSVKRSWRIGAKIHFFVARDCVKIAEQKLDGGEKIQIKLVTFEQFLRFSEETTFHNRDLIIEMLRARLDRKKKAALRKLILG